MKAIPLRTKVFVLFAGAMLLVVAPALVLIRKAVETGVRERAVGDLRVAVTALERTWLLRDSLLRTEASARAAAPGVARALLERDAARARRILSRGLDAERVAIAADTMGELLVGPAIDAALLREAQQVEGTSFFVNDGRQPMRVALWPVVTDSGVAGVAGVGARLGRVTVNDLKRDLASGTDIALVVGDSIIVTTFADSLARGLGTRGVSVGTPRAQGVWQRDVGERPYLTAIYRLPAEGLPASVLLFRPIGNELQIARTIVRSMVGIGMTALVMALILALVVARIVARPAQALAEASARLARGDFAAPLPRSAGDEIGQLARAFGEMRSAIAEREARLRSAQAEMIHREKLAAMGRLVAQLSHEINNPLYNIQNCLEALERRGDPRDPNREFLTLAQEELGRMASLTRRLLDQSRPLSDAAGPLDLNQVAQRVLLLATPELETRGVRVVTEFERGLPLVVAHPEAIHQVLANLVANARDAMDGGGTLTVRTRADADAVEVAVEDTGSGIAPEHLPHIFEAFYTTKPGIRGIGLGLFVSEGIIRGHRGRLSVESRAGEGSRLTIRLPRETLDERLGAGADSAPLADTAAASASSSA